MSERPRGGDPPAVLRAKPRWKQSVRRSLEGRRRVLAAKMRRRAEHAAVLPAQLLDGHRAINGDAPTASAVRHALEVAAHRPETRSVEVGNLLLGDQAGLSANAFAQATGMLRWPSTRLIAGAHADLLRRGRDGRYRFLSDDELSATAYVTHGLRCLNVAGAFRGATDRAGVLRAARDFLAFAEDPARAMRLAPARVRPVRHSACYQVVEGHHRLAIAAARGATVVPVSVDRFPVLTPLQRLLIDMTWLEGRRQLYQPVDAPEIDSNWTLVRRCTDRLERMLRHLSDPGGRSYLDVGSCYGWFVAQMGAGGYAAEGVEQDPLAPEIGKVAYGLDPDQVHVGDALEFLQRSARRWRVVSCFSLLHHFALLSGRDPRQLLRALDDATGEVLFLDCGQSHERWFEGRLVGWDPAGIEQLVRRHTSFTRVARLGVDDDDRPPFSGNYGRTLFACTRE